MIAIIPARGGSKGLPGKNTKLLGGIPLIAYTIMAARQASCIDKVCVSTDSENISRISKEYGAEVPYIRPSHLATDNASAVDVYIDIINYLRKNGCDDNKKFMVLLPTSPFRNSTHIEEAYTKFCECECDTLISVREAPVPPSWYIELKDGYIQSCEYGLEAGITKNRQEEKKYYIPNGAIYILDYDLLVSKRTYYSMRTIPYIMEDEDSIDIDTKEDFNYANYILRRK